MPYLCLWRRNFCAAGVVLLWLQRCDFWTVESLFLLSTAAQNIHVLFRKSPLCRSHFFEWLKTAISSNACGTATLKSLLSQAFFVPDVHPRPRKRPPRCTLDCGFKTSESPALRGFVAERGPIRGTSLYLVLKSNGLHRSKKLPGKFGFSPIDISANIVQKLPSQCCSKPLFIASFNFSRKCPTFAFTGESAYTLGFRREIAHSGSHVEAGAFPSAGTAWLCAANRIALNAAFATLDSTVLLYTYISRFSVNPHYQQTRKIRQSCRHKFYPQLFLVAFSTFPTNGPRSLSQAKAGTHSALLKGSHTRAYTAKHGPSGRGRYHYPRHVLHVHEHPRAGCQNGKLCRF